MLVIQGFVVQETYTAKNGKRNIFVYFYIFMVMLEWLLVLRG